MVKDWIPISHDNYKQVQGPFYHGTKANLAIGDLLTTGFISHFEDGRILKHIYFSALMEPAVWGAELAMSLSGLEGRGYIYIVEPTGPFEDDPNLTNKKFPGNPTQSYRTCEPLRIVGVVESWRYSLAATVLLLSPFDLLASLGMDMYLPAVPFMPNALGTTASTIQLTLTTYLVMIGAGQLLFGPLSDRLGRRPVLLGGGLAYVVASMGLALTSSAEVFLGLRILQACGASACLVSTFATVRDIYAGREESNVIYGILGSMLAMVPAVGPLLGALVDMWLGWRAIFAFLGLGMIAASAAAWRFWPETRVQRVAGLQWSQLLLPVKCLNFWLYTLCYAAGMGSFFVFFSIAPGLMMGRQGVSQLGFSLLFATVAIAMVFTARFMGRVIPKWGSPSVLRMGMGCLIAGAVLLAITEIWASQSVLGFIAPMWLVGIGVATAVSVSPNGALRGFDHVAGTVTAVYFCLGGVLLGSIGTLIISLLPRNTAWPVVVYCLTLATVVLGLSCVSRVKGSRGQGEHDVVALQSAESTSNPNR
ncbi:CmlA family chloramphenicol efflux MFS transporter [Klebsiella pneumoniae]